MSLTFCSAAGIAKADALPSGVRFDGTFIQYQGWMKTMNADAWRKELDAMRRAKISLIVVQWLQEEDNRYIPAEASAPDPTQIILDYADAHDMQVFVGLRTDAAWWKQTTDAAYLDREAASSIRLAEEAWTRYGKHRSFAGWYLPQELWDGAFDDGQIDRLRAFFRRVSDRCKTLSGGKPVAIAPFISHNAPPEVAEKVYTKLLKGAGIDILMLQDGVGAQGWDEEVAANVVPALRAFHDACLANGVEFWSDLESFHRVHGQPTGFVPADAARLGRQLTAEAPFVRRFVTFDFFHYMSPYRGAAQKTLYEDYLSRFVERAFFPTFGRSVEVDPAFSYYKGRTPESIASEVRADGYGIAHYILTADSTVRPALVDAFHREGMGVWYATFGNGTYSTQDLPAGWQAWKMVTRSDLEGKPLEDGYTRLCLNNPDYRAWKKRQTAGMLREHPFDGIDIMEPHWPEYPGPESPDYACFCPHCRAAFHRMFPEETELPDILHADSPRSPQRNPALWRKWLTFRQKSLTDFLNELVNGPGGLRASAPAANVCIWTLALSEPDGLRTVRESSGEDPADMARAVKPDLFCFQTHWPDWTRADLPPDYVKAYRPFVEAVRSAAPDLPLMIQADVGSQKQNRRSRAWIDAFEKACADLGVESTTYYEFFIRDAVYTEPPRIADVHHNGDIVEVIFTKRLDPKTAGDVAHYQLDAGRITAAHVDGNQVTLTVSGLPTEGLVTLTARGIADDAGRRLYPDRPAAVLAAQTVRFR